MKRFRLSILWLACLTFTGSPAALFAESAKTLLGDWALTLPTGEVGWLSVSELEGQPHVELMWAVGGVRSIEDANFERQGLTL